MPLQIVLCADDFALNAPVSQGIAALAAKGRLSATSALVLSPRWAQDVHSLHALRGRVDVGLHLDWTSAFAQSAGHGMPLGVLMVRAALDLLNPAVLRGVIERQLDTFEAHWHAPPDHIDGHHHVHQFRGIREALLETVQRRYPQNKPWVRVSLAPPGQRDLKAHIIAAWGAQALIRQANQARVPHSALLSGIYDFSGGEADYAQHMVRWLSEARAHTVLMCHPAQKGGVPTPMGRAGIWENAYLDSDAFARALVDAGVHLARGQDLFVHAPAVVMPV